MSAPRVRRQPALWSHLLGWALGVLLVVWLTLVAVAWSTGQREASKFTDGQLVAVSRLWQAVNPDKEAASPVAIGANRVQEYVQDMAVLVWRGNQLVTDTHHMAGGMELAQLQTPGFSTLEYRGNGHTTLWRAYVVEREHAGARERVAVLMDTEHRGELGVDVAEHIAEPALLLLPLAALLLWWALRRGMRPLDQLSEEVARLDGMAGQRLDTQHRFREFSSTVAAINQLVDGLQAQAIREREFASDVAHELRTPLASIALQAGAARLALEGAGQAQPAQGQALIQSLQSLEQESLRAGHILAQLLDLARAQRLAPSAEGGAPAQAREVNLGKLATQVLADHAQTALDSGHELSLEQPDAAVQVTGTPMLVELALRNLIHNALRHTLAGTQVRVNVWRSADAAGVSVSDDGARIQVTRAQPDANKVGEGLGLGLRLVERIARDCGARLERDAGEPPMTTRFTLRWDRAASAASPR